MEREMYTYEIYGLDMDVTIVFGYNQGYVKEYMENRGFKNIRMSLRDEVLKADKIVNGVKKTCKYILRRKL